MFLNLLILRYERPGNHKLGFKTEVEWKRFFKLFYNFSGEQANWKNYILFNIIKLDLIDSYRAWRQTKGFPSHGQRTWSNGWSSYRNNTILRNFKLGVSKKFYGNLNNYEFKLAFWSEFNNRLWYNQWLVLWEKARHQRHRAALQKANQSALKLDLKAVASGEIFLPSLDRELTKKQKAKISKTWMMLGFNLGFTKSLFKQEDGATKYLIEDKRLIAVNVITFTKKAPSKPKKKKDEKARLKAHKIKKKKKKQHEISLTKIKINFLLTSKLLYNKNIFNSYTKDYSLNKIFSKTLRCKILKKKLRRFYKENIYYKRRIAIFKKVFNFKFTSYFNDNINVIFINKLRSKQYLISFKKKSGILKNRINFYKNLLFNFNESIRPKLCTNYVRKKTLTNTLSLKTTLFKYNFRIKQKYKNKTLKKFYFKKGIKKNWYQRHRTLSFKRRWIFRMRDNRNLIKFLLFLKTDWQEYRLTNYLKQFSNVNISNFLLKLEFALSNLLIRSRFAITIVHVKQLLKLNLIFVNGILVKDYWLLLSKKDRINVVYNIKYFKYYKYIKLILNKREKKTKYCLWRMYRNKYDFYKQKPKHLPHWLTHLMYKYAKTPLYLEVDYTSLTCIIIRHPRVTLEYNWYFIQYFAFHMLKTYRWKYIT